MQIHELNNYTGDLDSGAYVAVDNGNDTGKVSAQKLLKAVNDDITELDNELNARIDNIIAGGDAPSAAEVTDARQGISGATYQSLGDAVRGQASDLEAGLLSGEMTMSAYKLLSVWQLGGINGTTGMNENSSIYCRTRIEYPLYAKNACVIKALDTDFYCFIYQYNDAACTDCVGELGYIGPGVSSKDLPQGYYYRFKAVKVPTTTITDTVIEGIIQDISIVEKTLSNIDVARIVALEQEATDHETRISDLEDKYYLEYGLNRNPGNDAQGWIDSDGSIKTTGSYWHTDYCYVGDCDEVVCSVNAVGLTLRYAQNMAFLATYDEDKTFIERVYTTGSPYYTVGAGVKYIRFCIDPSVIENVMLQSGNTFSPVFIPYEAPQEKLKPEYYHSGSDWSNKKWAAVGDSLTERNQRSDKNYHDYVNEVTGIEVVNMGSSGTGYKRDEGNNKAFYQRILNVPLDTDVVTIFGSGNDLNYSAMGYNSFADALGDPTDSGTSTICGCINKTIENLYSILPTVQLGIVTPCPWQGYNPSNESNNMAVYSAAIVEICRLHGIPCLDLYHCSAMRPWDATFRSLCYSKDEGNGTHPDEKGHEILAPHFKAFLSEIVL